MPMTVILHGFKCSYALYIVYFLVDQSRRYIVDRFLNGEKIETETNEGVVIKKAVALY